MKLRLCICTLILLVLITNNTFAQDVDDYYPLSVCQTCNYHELDIVSMRFRDLDTRQRVSISDPQSVIELLYALPGRDIWIGYPQGYDMPEDVQLRYRIQFTVSSNTLSGPLMYQGELYDSLTLENDWIEIWIWSSDTTAELYIMPFRTLAVTCTPQGEHCGSHLWGAYAVSEENIEDLVDTISQMAE